MTFSTKLKVSASKTATTPSRKTLVDVVKKKHQRMTCIDDIKSRIQTEFGEMQKRKQQCCLTQSTKLTI
jgi:hypothetical protein